MRPEIEKANYSKIDVGCENGEGVDAVCGGLWTVRCSGSWVISVT